MHCCQPFAVVTCVLTLAASTGVAQTTDADTGAARQADAYRLYLLGRHLDRTGDLDGAIRSYREAAELDQGSGEALAELATLYARRNLSEEAIAAGNAALEREPTNQSARKILGLIYAASASEAGASPEDARLATEHLEQARGTLLPDFQVEVTLARLYLGTSAPNKAITLLEELLEDEPGFSEAGLLLAQAYEQVGETDEAVATLEGVVQNDRPSARVLRRLGELYQRNGRLPDAIKVYEQAIERSPRSTQTRRQLAGALLEDGQDARARDVLRELVTMRPKDAAGLYLLSEVELDLGNFAAAERVARRLIASEPEGIRGPLALADVYVRRREHQSVIDTLEPALQTARRLDLRSDQIASVLGRLGFAYEQLQDYEGASLVYEEAVELLPTSLAFGARLAQTYVETGRLADASRELQRIQEHHSDDLTLTRLAARVLGDSGDVSGGIELLQEALQSHEGEPMAYVALAGFYSEHERLDDAVELLESAQSRFPDDTSILFQLGAVFEQSERHVDAERTFRRVLDRDPEHAATLNYLGYMLADRGERLNESVVLLERAIEIDPNNGAYLDSLGWAYFKLDRLDLAETLLQQASEQLQWNSVIQDHLGDVMLKLGRYQDAIVAWERALAGDGEEVESPTIERKISDAQRRLGR